MASEPPRPRVVISFDSGSTPWNPATITTRPWARLSRTLVPCMSRILAEPWEESVRMPAWDPVKLTAGMPRELRVIESRAIEIRSPALSSMSISRGEGRRSPRRPEPPVDPWSAPMAETTTTTSWPSARVDSTRSATALIRAASASEVPPNFWTTRDMTNSLERFPAKHEHRPRDCRRVRA